MWQGKGPGEMESKEEQGEKKTQHGKLSSGKGGKRRNAARC